MRKTCIILFISFIAACTSYDDAILYHKNFEPGKNELLRFDGYYSDTLGRELDADGTKLPKPIYFYADGSVYAYDYYFSKGDNALPEGSWGNYMIHLDSITVEKFQNIENEHKRITMKGVISKDRIRWFSRQERKHTVQAIDYSIFFHSDGSKPDSTKNYTRIWPKYNH